MTSKTELRKFYLAKRKALAPADAQRDSTLIRQRLTRMAEWEDARTILCYISTPHEVETRKIIDETLGRRKRVIVPIFDGSPENPRLSELRSLQELVSGSRPGLLEHAPKHRRPFETKEVELVIVPGVTFDRDGGRIGFGGGYFDRLLAGMPQAVRLALSYSLQIHTEALPLDGHDIRMHKILTEKELIIAPR